MDQDQREDVAAPKQWRAGETFFAESGGHPAQGSDGSDGGGGDTHLPASDEDDPALREETRNEPQSWPGSGGPGSFPPPG